MLLFIELIRKDCICGGLVFLAGLKLENGNLGEMKRVYELHAYKPAEELSDRVLRDFEKWYPFKAIVKNPAQD